MCIKMVLKISHLRDFTLSLSPPPSNLSLNKSFTLGAPIKYAPQSFMEFPYSRRRSLHHRPVRGAHLLRLLQVDRRAGAAGGRGAQGGRHQEQARQEAQDATVPPATGHVAAVQAEGEEKIAGPEDGGHQGLVPARVRGHEPGRRPVRLRGGREEERRALRQPVQGRAGRPSDDRQ